MKVAFELVAQTAEFVVLNKAAGISFHSEQGAGLVVKAEQILGFKLFPVHPQGSSCWLAVARPQLS